MDKNLTYCEVRYGLEERVSTLASMLFRECSRLMRLIGQDHQAFLLAKQECGELRKQIAVSRRALLDHRVLHEC